MPLASLPRRARRVSSALVRAPFWPWRRWIDRADAAERVARETRARNDRLAKEMQASAALVDRLRRERDDEKRALEHELDRARERANDRMRRIVRFGYAYRGLRAAALGLSRAGELGDPPGRAPEGQERADIEAAVMAQHRMATFAQTLGDGRGLESAVAELVRSVRGTPNYLIGRQVAQWLHDCEATHTAGLLGTGLVAHGMGLHELAWARLSLLPPAVWLAHAPNEYVMLAGRFDRGVCERALAEALSFEGSLPTRTWLDLTRRSMGLGLVRDLPALADRFEASAEKALAAGAIDADERKSLELDVEWVRRWVPRVAAGVPDPPPRREGTVPFGVIGYDQPDRRNTSSNIGDYVQTIASLAHLARHTGVRFDESDLGRFATGLAERVPQDLRRAGPTAKVDLHQVDRDASSYSKVPDGTWMLAFGWYAHRIGGVRYDLPFPDRLRPLYVSFHLNKRALLSDSMVAHLRRCAPIGCRDWSTVDLLLGLDIPAFFSGCLTTTVRYIKPEGRERTADELTLWVDTPAPTNGENIKNERPEVARRPMIENLEEALDILDIYAFDASRVVTKRLHAYLPARSLGCPVEFVPANSADVRFNGLAPLTDEDVFDMGRRIADILAPAIDAILTQGSEQEVRAAWTEATAGLVEQARERHQATVELTQPIRFAELAERIRSQQVHIASSESGPTGDPMDLVLALDGNLKEQFRVVVDGLVSHASRPMRLRVLCREHDSSDFEFCRQLFPTVEFFWYPCDEVDYGDVHSMISHITVATMDRLILPELLDEVARVLYLDIDTLALVDVAPLFETDLQGTPLAARDSETSEMASGYSNIFVPAANPDLPPGQGAELIRRETARHAFDWTGFNAGVMVLDLNRMRADEFCHRFLPYATAFGMHDQHILNVYAGPDRVRLDPAWNARPTQEVISNPGIVHWAGEQKPWKPGYVPYRELWRTQEAALQRRERELLGSGDA